MENFKDIKIGGIYDLRIVVESKRDNALLVCTLSDSEMQDKPRYVLHRRDACDLRQVSPENGIKNTEPAPKYDPCRKFKKGDKVRVFAYKGRTPKNHPTDEGCVLKDENDYNTVIVNFGENGRWQINVAYLELVTPVDELEPYSVTCDDGGHYVCDKEGMVISLYYNNIHPNAKAAAEAECARLNEEHRKEQK